MRRLWPVLLVLVLCPCCVTTMLPGAQTVRVTNNPEVVRGCQFLGNAKGSSNQTFWWGGDGALDEENTDRQLRNAAVQMGGNVVLLVSLRTGYGSMTSRGEVYRCE